MTITTLDKHINYPYIRAFQSRHVIYQPNIPPADPQTGLRDQQIPIRSSFAMPIAGENGLPLGVLYVTSHIRDAFTQDDQRILRLMCRMIDELLKTYRARQQATRYLTDIVKRPAIMIRSLRVLPLKTTLMLLSKHCCHSFKRLSRSTIKLKIMQIKFSHLSLWISINTVASPTNMETD